MKAFVLAETADAARELCAGARANADSVILVQVGTAPVTGIADKVLHVDVPQGSIADDAYETVNAAYDQESPEIIFVEPTRRMRALAGRLAAHAQTSVITDIFELEGGVASNLYFGGVGQRKYKAKTGSAIYTIGSGLFDGSTAAGTDVVEELAFQTPEKAVRLVDSKDLPASDGNLAKADVVVSAGRGFSEEADLSIARDLCSKIGGELACSRPLTEGVDWLPKSTYVGVSGLMLSPKVYLAVGISGQMQHMVGCNRSSTIIAINKDKNAPIFQQCDYGIVGDLKTIVPALTQAL